MSECKVCGESLNTGRKFCSYKCYAVYRSKPSPLCLVCSEPVKYHGRKFCSVKCFGIWHSANFRGENNPSWIGGTTRDTIYSTAKWIKFSNRIMKRDNYECQICRSNDCRLNAHHIYPAKEYPSLFWEDSNIVTLCPSCHMKIEGTDWGKELVIIPKFGAIA